jgi:hypothetical protein
MTPFQASPDHHRRNAELLALYQRCRSTTNRNAVIRANLPLVWQVARQEAKRSGQSFEDLTQEGYLGLIQAAATPSAPPQHLGSAAPYGTTFATAAMASAAATTCSSCINVVRRSCSSGSSRGCPASIATP